MGRTFDRLMYDQEHNPKPAELSEAPCLNCGEPCIAGVNSDFCSLACEEAYGKELTIKLPIAEEELLADAVPFERLSAEQRHDRIVTDIIRIMVGQAGVLAYMRSKP
jgi:hypothetical protein